MINTLASKIFIMVDYGQIMNEPIIFQEPGRLHSYKVQFSENFYDKWKNRLD